MVYNSGRLYVRALVDPSFGTNEIAILDATNGHLLTAFQPGAPSIPAISAGVGFTENQGTLIAFDAQTGATLWSKTNPGDQFVTAPIVVNDTVFEGTSSGKLFALDPHSGVQLSITNVGQQLFRPQEQNAVILPGIGLAMGSWWCPQVAW